MTNDPTLFDVLKTAIAERRWSIPQFAHECEVSVQLAYKWLAEDEAARITPGPRSCAKIASALNLDPDYVLELAGHRMPQTERPVIDPDVAAFAAVWPSLDEGIQQAIRILAGLRGQGPVTVAREHGVSQPRRRVTRATRASNGQLPNCYPRSALAFAGTR